MKKEAGSGEEQWQFLWTGTDQEPEYFGGGKKKKKEELHPLTTEKSQPHPKAQLAAESFLTMRSRLEREPGEVGCTGAQRYF